MVSSMSTMLRLSDGMVMSGAAEVAGAEETIRSRLVGTLYPFPAMVVL